MKIPSFIKILIACSVSILFQSTAVASDSHDHHKSQCDLVALNGSGQLQQDGSIVGTEVLTILNTGRQVDMKFTATPLGIVDVDYSNPDAAVISMVASHDFSSMSKRNFNFTTIDELSIVPFGEDTSCIENACGLKFSLKLETGNGRYNCGEIVSGINIDPTAAIPFTSYVDPLNPAADGGTVILNSVGKLCRCRN